MKWTQVIVADFETLIFFFFLALIFLRKTLAIFT